MELLMKFYTINHFHYHHLVPLTEWAVRVQVILMFDVCFKYQDALKFGNLISLAFFICLMSNLNGFSLSFCLLIIPFSYGSKTHNKFFDLVLMQAWSQTGT